MDKTGFLAHLHDFDLTGLFTECGWDSPSSAATISIVVGEQTFVLREVAQKGMKIFSCETNAFPLSSIRRALDAKIRKFCHAYFIVFKLSGEPFHHQWMVPVDAVDKRRLIVFEYLDDSHAEALYDKVLGISFGLEETPSILDVVARVNAQFLINSSDITTKFYDGFRKQHDAFVDGLEGILDKEHKSWYASVMLNRLMFCYFIQKKGFFMDRYGNSDFDYLHNKLNEVVAKKGKDKFYVSFYKGFLRGLFESGLNTSAEHRPESFKDKYGLIPYLNGGMFELHRLEQDYKDIDVPDKVFESLFAFFDEWKWHLDDRIERDGRDINPDVLGYIFEKYINDRAQMGAYYTKEDVTNYIVRNTIIPYILNAVRTKDVHPFAPDGEIWNMLKDSEDEYIFDAVKKGVVLKFPEDIAVGESLDGVDVRKRRAKWGTLAKSEYALPLETWSEVVERRNCYHSIKRKIANGEICNITDFITYNLNLQKFAENIIRNTQNRLLIKHFYDVLREITILDPTCGSGAFLFASLNILEPLYEACIDRMEEYNAQNQKHFKDELAEIKDKYRSNRQYFIYKNIILRNLYGVDIMHEATEIARLRLFLKMVAVVEADASQDNLGLDPLPDVDFNIKCGNTLVGYASHDHLQKALDCSRMVLFSNKEKKIAMIDVKASDIAVLCNRFRTEQLSGNASFFYRKGDLRKALDELRDMLDETLAKTEYDIDITTAKGKKEFNLWRDQTKPFHWYSEFFNIIVERSGFDVIIGNPPYVSRNKIEYLNDELDFKCSDLYGYVIRRVFQILRKDGCHGFIVMHNLAFSDDFKYVRKLIFDHSKVRHFSFYSRIPAGLFSGDCRVRNTIYLTSNSSDIEVCYTTRLHRWYQEQRETLFSNIKYGLVETNKIIPMSEYPNLLAAMTNKNGLQVGMLFSKYNKYPIYYKKLAYNFLSISEEEPPCYYPNKKKAPQTGIDSIFVDTKEHRDLLWLLFSGRLYFAKWCVFGDDFHYTLGELKSFSIPLDAISEEDKKELSVLVTRLRNESSKTVQYKLNAGKYVGTYNTSKNWYITDESDLIFLKYICENPIEVQEEVIAFVNKMAITNRKEEQI